VVYDIAQLLNVRPNHTCNCGTIREL